MVCAIIALAAANCTYESKYTLVDPPPLDEWIVTKLPRPNIEEVPTPGEASGTTPPAVAAAALVTEGVSISLSHPLLIEPAADSPSPFEHKMVAIPS